MSRIYLPTQFMILSFIFFLNQMIQPCARHFKKVYFLLLCECPIMCFIEKYPPSPKIVIRSYILDSLVEARTNCMINFIAGMYENKDENYFRQKTFVSIQAFIHILTSYLSLNYCNNIPSTQFIPREEAVCSFRKK